MPPRLPHSSIIGALLLLLLVGAAGPGLAADVARPPAVPAVEMVSPPGWTYQFTPYGWFTGLRGTQTVRGRSAKVNASFIDIFDDTAGQGGTLVGLMGDFEARSGPFSFYGDLVWSKLGAERNHVSTRATEPGIVGTVGRSISLDIEMAIVEGGATYEAARIGPLAFDVLGGFRYWHQQADLTFERTQTFDIADLEVTGTRAIAASGSYEWLDPVIGARLRYAVAPGHNLFLRGDIGGFGAGSSFSWQAVGGYSFDFATYNGVIFSGVVGYRALYVDYSQGEGRQRYEFDMLQHGPLLGVTARF